MGVGHLGWDTRQGMGFQTGMGFQSEWGSRQGMGYQTGDDGIPNRGGRVPGMLMMQYQTWMVGLQTWGGIPDAGGFQTWDDGVLDRG